MRRLAKTLGLFTALALLVGFVSIGEARTPAPGAKLSTLRRAASSAIHKQYRMNYFTRNARVRVTKFKLNPNKMTFDRQGKAVGYTATVRVGSQKFPASGFIHQQRYVPRGHKRVHPKSGTPAPLILVR
jgi:hypothetical protein